MRGDNVQRQNQGPLVMVIDDSLTMRTILQTSLRRAGFAVVSYADGVQALEDLRTHRHPQPDVLLLDIGLPKLDGYTLARLFTGEAVREPPLIIMLSGRTGIVDRLKGRLAGAQAYLTKPVRQEEVLDCVRMLLANRAAPQSGAVHG